MKPNNNHRWNRCRIDEDYCLTFGHGEQFFRAFDKAFKPVGSNPDGSILYSSQVSKGKAETIQIVSPDDNGSQEGNSAIVRRRQFHCSRSVGFDETMEVKYDTTKLHTSKSEISTNVNAAGTRHISEDMLGRVEREPNKSPSNFVQEQPSGSIPQPAVDLAGKVCPARINPASHASARIFTQPNPRCALATPNEEPASDFCSRCRPPIQESLQSCILRGATT